jgi:hypothetical protein
MSFDTILFLRGTRFPIDTADRDKALHRSSRLSIESALHIEKDFDAPIRVHLAEVIPPESVLVSDSPYSYLFFHAMSVFSGFAGNAMRY